MKEVEVQIIENEIDGLRNQNTTVKLVFTGWRSPFPEKNDSEYEASIAAQNLKSSIS